ncbi:MAG TPA: beta-galactosidase [Actinoplanes sp.]|nr:beta-galactosidase [Actinoplanes sp.]
MSWPEPLFVRHQAWATPLRRPRMSNAEDVRPGLSLTNRYLTRDGVPVIPVSGEMHFSRVPRARWAERLRQMKAGGITVVATYLFWLHHQPVRDQAPNFDGELDVAAFVDLAVETGLDVVLRIGPWCHGEARNGGFPDWVQQAPVRHRTDDPDYLTLVEGWFSAIGRAVGPSIHQVIGIQLENELYDQPQHLVTLKRLAREAGLSAPLWTATAWGGADLPDEEVLPLYGGYGDGFWVDADAPWDPTFRDHYFFSHVWDDAGIGADVRRAQAIEAASGGPRTPSDLFPAATCELGGGMATAYHRRPRPEALDVATIAHCKIGNGSAWQGYYMYTGGTNPGRDLQETHATGYPNDITPLGYDFHAPVGEAGVLAASHAELRRQHAFLAAFGHTLAEMPSSLPAVRPSGVEDSSTLRFALRSDGTSGFLFLAWHQPHFPLPVHTGARFRVALASGELEFPSQPVDVQPGTLASWPLNLTLGGVTVTYATASALTVLPGDVPTLVLIAEPGIPAEIAVSGDVHTVTPGFAPLSLDGLDVLVLPAESAGSVWVVEDGGRRLLLSDDELQWDASGTVFVKGGYPSGVQVYTGRAFAAVPMPLPELLPPPTVTVEEIRPAATTVPVAYGKHDGRPSAPSPEVFDELAAVHRLTIDPTAALGDSLLHIRWAGDIGELRVDGTPITDRYWDGAVWTVNLTDIGWTPSSDLTLHLLPLAAGSPVSVPADVRSRLTEAETQLLSIDSVEVVTRTTLTLAL